MGYSRLAARSVLLLMVQILYDYVCQPRISASRVGVYRYLYIHDVCIRIYIYVHKAFMYIYIYMHVDICTYLSVWLGSCSVLYHRRYVRALSVLKDGTDFRFPGAADEAQTS